MWVGHTTQTWQAGTRLRVRRDPVTVSGAAVPQPWRMIGLCDPVPLGTAPQETEILDSSSGEVKLVGKHVVRRNEIYEVQSRDLNLNNLCLLYGNVLPQAYAQTAATLTAVAHDVWPGAEVALYDATGKRMYMAKKTGLSLETVSGSTALVEGVDYVVSPEGLDEGFITILPTSTVITAKTAVNITYQVNAISGDRLILPDFTACGNVYCDAELVWSRCDGGEKTVRQIRAMLSVSQTNIQVEQQSTITVRIEKITDPSKPNPDGQLIYIKGKTNN